jgi:hypothetical protein
MKKSWLDRLNLPSALNGAWKTTAIDILYGLLPKEAAVFNFLTGVENIEFLPACMG